MASNILSGPNSRVALGANLFTAMGLSSVNTVVVYLAEGNYKSWKPGRLVNAIVGTEQGKGYIIISKGSLDLSEYFAPPLVNPVTFRYVSAVNGIVNV